MSGRSERIRDEIINSGSPLSNHSLNQGSMSLLLDGEARLFGNPNNKARKAEKRRIRHEQFLRDLPRTQFERSLGKLIQGKGNDEDESYVWANISKYAKHLPHLSSDNGHNITVVDLTPMGRAKTQGPV